MPVEESAMNIYLPESHYDIHKSKGPLVPHFGASAKLLWKATISFAMPICPSARMEQLDSHRTGLREICCWGFLWSFVDTIKFWLQLD
jgi:hypothetical protein